MFHFYTLWNVAVEVSQILENQQIRVKATKCMDLEPRPQPSKVKKKKKNLIVAVKIQ